MSIKDDILLRIQQGSRQHVWTANDFFDLGERDAIDQALKRLTEAGLIRRVHRGLYDLPQLNPLTKSSTVPDYRQVISAISRRDHIRTLIDGLTAANNLGLTNAVTGQVLVLTDGRLRPIQIGNLIIQFKKTSPSKLFWSDRPAVEIVQAIYWLRDVINNGESEAQEIEKKLIQILSKSNIGSKLTDDLRDGLYSLPSWMQEFINKILSKIDVVE